MRFLLQLLCGRVLLILRPPPLASECKCARRPGEDDSSWEARLVAIKSEALVDYAPFIQAISQGISTNLANPVPFTTAGIATAIRQSWAPTSSVAPRLAVVDEFSSPTPPGQVTFVATTLLVSTSLYTIPANLVNGYNACSADRIKRSNFLDRLVPFSCSTVFMGDSDAEGAAAGAQSQAELRFAVFGDDDARQAHCNNSPVRLLLHRVESGNQRVALLASCSCNSQKEGLVERLLDKALHSPGGEGFASLECLHFSIHSLSCHSAQILRRASLHRRSYIIVCETTGTPYVFTSTLHSMLQLEKVESSLPRDVLTAWMSCLLVRLPS